MAETEKRHYSLCSGSETGKLPVQNQFWMIQHFWQMFYSRIRILTPVNPVIQS